MKLSFVKLFKLLIWILTFSNIASKIAIAQITSDGTLNTQVETNDNVAEITGGETRGANLFHSFQDFSVPKGNEAFFNNANNITNIFSRVTGGNVSNIDGVIRANSSASLFLINPAGIILGEGARLDIGGSFYGSTADSILFEKGEFSATDLETTPLLTINAPIGLSFRDRPGEITVRGNGNGVRLVDSEIIDTQDALRVDTNSTLGIIGGDINFEDATLKTAGGRFEIGSVAGGEVNLVAVANGFTFDYSEIPSFQDIGLTGTSTIDASGNGGGEIQIVGRNITLQDLSGIEANTLGDAPGSEINILAAESIELSGIENENNFITAISNRVFPNATGNAGNVNIETGSLSIGDLAAITTSNSGQGNAGTIQIKARGSVSLASEGNLATIISSNFSESVADAGNIEITTSSLTISDGALLFANNSGSGIAGNVKIEAANNVDLTNSSQINTSGNTSNSGNIEVTANSLTVDNQSGLFTANLETGEAGDILINTLGDINVTDNSFLNANGTNNNAGNIEVTANSLTVDNQSLLSVVSLNQGVGGKLAINTIKNFNLTNSSALGASGAPGGFVNINSQNLSILSGSTIFANNMSETNMPDIQSGDIVINLTEDLIIDGSNGEQSTTIGNSSFGQGNSGNIEVNARNITLDNGGTVNSFTSSNGNTGNITINTSGDIILNGINGVGRSGIFNFINAGATGNVGEINLTAQNLTLTNGSQIESLVAGIANSGDINLDIDNTITIDGFGNVTVADASGILPSTIASNITSGGVGNAGSINIDTQNLALSRNGQISTTITEGQGNAGDININANLITIGKPGTTAISPSNITSEANTGIVDDALLEANAGNIVINTRSLFISDGSSIEAGISALGNGGDITINATDTVSVDGTGLLVIPELDSGLGAIISATIDEVEVSSAIRSTAILNSFGNGGNIEINAANLALSNNAVVNTSNSGQGNAGNISIDVANVFSATNTSIVSSNIGTAQGVAATGKVGAIEIKAEEVVFSDTAQVQAGLFSGALGDPGLISVTAAESISFTGENTGIFSDNDPNSVGNASNTQLSAPKILLDDGAVIQASNQGDGNGGNILITADNLELGQDNQINAFTVSGIGGTVTLDIAENIILRSNNFISAEALNDANGGIVDIDANFVIAFPNGNNDIVASAEQGQGGNISINANSIFGIEERPLNDSTNDINASSDVFGFEGTVDITTLDTNPIEGATELPTNIVESDQTIAQVCSNYRQISAQSRLIVNGKGGILPAPDLPLNSLNIFVSDQSTINDATIPPAVITSSGKIQPARGVRVNDSGEIQLTAYHTDNSGNRLTNKQHNCRG
ncbi:MAG: filamentous hemagglutinin N-terminal domain-containing protein [Cyanobacteria bacterium P01_E01_bin.35]